MPSMMFSVYPREDCPKVLLLQRRTAICHCCTFSPVDEHLSRLFKHAIKGRDVLGPIGLPRGPIFHR